MDKQEINPKKIPSKGIMKELRQFGSYHSFQDMIKPLEEMKEKENGKETP